MSKKYFLLIIYVLFCSVIGGCAWSKAQYVGQRAEGPKEISLSSQSEPWLIEIEKALRAKGFRVYRMASQRKIQHKIDESTTETYNESSSRYVLSIDGEARIGVMNRCFGGGYFFHYLTAELVDMKNNETIMSVTKSGYSENCPPLSGHVYTGIAEDVANAWDRTSN